MRKVWFLGLIVVLTLTTQVRAQYIVMPVPPAPIFPVGAMGNIVIENLQADEAARASSPSSGNRENQVRSGSFSFSYSPVRTQQNLRKIVARTPIEAGQTELEQALIAQPGIMEDIAAGVRIYGFDSHNVADAFAVWWINVWGASQKRNIEPDAATVAAVKQQVYNAFAATPDFAKTSDAERQEYAEALLLQAAMLGSAFEQMKNDPAQLERLAAAARQGAEAQGLDLSKMTLTSNGFVPREGADAGDAVDENEDTIRNARADAPSTEGESSGLGLALAAGAGLGVTLLGGLALMRRG